MSVRATCPHCGAKTSEVRSTMRCWCGWADPNVHPLREPRVVLELTTDQALGAAIDPRGVLAEVGRQLGEPPVSDIDGKPVLHREPYRYVEGDFT